MPVFENPTKEDVKVMLERMARDTTNVIEKGQKFAEQLQRLTDADLKAIGFADTGSPSQIDYIRSCQTAFLYLAKYWNKEDTTAYVDDPSYSVKHFLNIRNFG